MAAYFLACRGYFMVSLAAVERPFTFAYYELPLVVLDTPVVIIFVDLGAKGMDGTREGGNPLVNTT